jgi:predicted O-methyltransferase YrrM
MKNPLQRNKRRFQALENRIIFLEAALETFLNSPVYVDSENIGFNGQKIRKMIFNDLCEVFSFEAILETGTFTGNTTGYMAKTTGLPVYTSESNSILVALARKRLEGIDNINCYLMDSREFLKILAEKYISNKRVFIYLDAHCHDDLPLKQEIEIICQAWKEFVIMIDDFQVPGDAGYGYDRYGDKKVLSTKDFMQIFTQNGLTPFFPAMPSGAETGARRGSVILTRKGDFAEQVGNCRLLTKYQR